MSSNSCATLDDSLRPCKALSATPMLPENERQTLKIKIIVTTFQSKESQTPRNKTNSFYPLLKIKILTFVKSKTERSKSRQLVKHYVPKTNSLHHVLKLLTVVRNNFPFRKRLQIFRHLPLYCIKIFRNIHRWKFRCTPPLCIKPADRCRNLWIPEMSPT